MNRKFKVLDSGTFPFDVLLTIGTTPEEISNKLKKFGICVLKEELRITNQKGKTWFGENKNGSWMVCWLRKKTNDYIPYLVHELLHATFEIMNRAGIKLSDDSDEVFTYELENLTRQSLKFFEKL